MAPVTQPRDRGQLILVAGLTVAVILVMLVLLLNTVIYTENLATRGIDSGAGDAIEYRATVVGSIEELIERENERYDEGHPPVKGVLEGVGLIDETLSERYLTRGTVADIRYSNDSVNEGPSVVWQNESGNFTAGGKSNWTVAENVTAIDRFNVTVDSADQWENGTDDSRLRIVVADPDSDPWTLEVNAANESEFEVRSNDSNPYLYLDGPLEIDPINGTVSNDTTSENITPAPTSAETIEYKNGNTTTGTFDLRFTGTPGERVTKYGEGSGDEPYYTDLVDSVDLTLHYETSELRFVTEETIIPEEEP